LQNISRRGRFSELAPVGRADRQEHGSDFPLSTPELARRDRKELAVFSSSFLLGYKSTSGFGLLNPRGDDRPCQSSKKSGRSSGSYPEIRLTVGKSDAGDPLDDARMDKLTTTRPVGFIRVMSTLAQPQRLSEVKGAHTHIPLYGGCICIHARRSSLSRRRKRRRRNSPTRPFPGK